MENIALAKEKAFFLNKYKFSVLNNCSIVRCEVKIANIDSEIISGKEVRIFGDYDISICYKTDSYYSSNLNKKQYNYQASSTKRFFLAEKKSFSKVISFKEIKKDLENIQNLDLKYTFISGPDVKANIINKNISDTFIYVEVFGEIDVEFFSCQIENTTIKENLSKDIILLQKAEDLKEDVNLEKQFKELKKEIDSHDKIEKMDLSKTANNEEEDLVKVSFYTKENEQFVRSGGNSHKNTNAPVTVKKNKHKFKKELIENAKPIQSWMFQIKENLSISDILKMGIDELKKMQEQKEPMSVDEKEEQIEESKKVSLEENEDMKNIESIKENKIEDKVEKEVINEIENKKISISNTKKKDLLKNKYLYKIRTP